MNSIRNKLTNSWVILVACVIGYATGALSDSDRMRDFFSGLAVGAFLAASKWPQSVYSNVSKVYGALVDVLNVYYERFTSHDAQFRISDGDAERMIRSAQETVFEFQKALKSSPDDLQVAAHHAPKWDPSGMKPSAFS